MSVAEDVRETRPEDFAAYSEKYGPFDLDAACTLSNCLCPVGFTELGRVEVSSDGSRRALAATYDGLTADWFGRVFVNPPFSELSLWISKCWGVMDGCPEVVSITCTIPNTRSEQPFWQHLIEPYRDHKQTLVDRVKLITDNQPVRKKFLQGGKPILDKNGRIGAARFGVTILHWSRE